MRPRRLVERQTGTHMKSRGMLTADDFPRNVPILQEKSLGASGSVSRGMGCSVQRHARPIVLVLAGVLALVLSPARDARASAVASPWGACTLIDAFLNQLMIAESGGRLFAKNPRSSALGPFQFINSTFLDVTRRHLPDETEDLPATGVLQLRTDPDVARRAAKAYSRENAAYLVERGLKASTTNLHLAFFAGPSGAARVLSAHPDTPVARLLSPAALGANPFLRGMTAGDLIAKSARHVGIIGLLSLKPKVRKTARRHPGIRVRCNLGLASCRKWLYLAKKRLARKRARLARKASTAARR